MRKARLRRNSLSPLLPAMLAAGLSACSATSSPPPQVKAVLHCGPDGKPDRLTVDGKAFAFPSEGDDIGPLSTALGDGRLQVHLIADNKDSYRCMGSAIFALQRNGFSKFGFIADPAPDDKEKP